jgi:DNA-binding response OmpR family regulator
MFQSEHSAQCSNRNIQRTLVHTTANRFYVPTGTLSQFRPADVRPRELLARLRAIIRRASRFSPEDADVYAFSDVMVDFYKSEITRAGEKIAVTPKELKTLEFFARNAERVISREELLNEVWGYQNYPYTRTVDNHMLRLRQKLESEPSKPLHFLTVYGQGYKFLP